MLRAMAAATVAVAVVRSRAWLPLNRSGMARAVTVGRMPQRRSASRMLLRRGVSRAPPQPPSRTAIGAAGVACNAEVALIRLELALFRRAPGAAAARRPG